MIFVRATPVVQPGATGAAPAPAGAAKTATHEGRSVAGQWPHAIAPKPFFATSVNSFNDAPRGLFWPRSHWLTSPVVTLR